MSLTVVRYRTKPEYADENEALVEKVFGELNADRPERLQYATFRLADGVSFVHVAAGDRDEDPHPLTSLPVFQAFAAGLGERCAEGDGPVVSDATLVGSYNLEVG